MRKDETFQIITERIYWKAVFLKNFGKIVQEEFLKSFQICEELFCNELSEVA